MSAFDEELLEEEDEEMPLTERDLADDAQWKIIQKNTFTRWANEHLKTVNKSINDLETEFSDGLRLVALIEVLSGKKFKFVNRRPNFRTQKLENVTMCLEFLERDEGIRIVNIDSGDIVDSKLKLILGLIWTLILHYSISMPMWEGEEPQPSEGGPTPKQRLLNWIQGKVPDVPIKNFTTDWNDGKAIGALVDAIAPGLCPDWEDWDPKKAKQNAKEALDAAEKWLDVPQLIRPEEMTNPKVDDLSMMTYLSQFPQAKLKPGAPLRPRLNANRVRAWGPGLEPKGNMVGQPAKFTVETFSAGKGELEILVLDPKGKQNPYQRRLNTSYANSVAPDQTAIRGCTVGYSSCESVFNKDRNQTYSCQYVPAMEGEYRVIIKFGGKEIHKSPFKVLVEGAAGDPTKVTAKGPGLEKTGVSVNVKTYFEVFTKGAPVKGRLPGTAVPGGKDAGRGTVEVVIMDPSGHRDKVKATVSPANKDGVYRVEYTPVEVGLHSININFGGVAIPNSPFGVNVSPAINAKAVYATGRGIQPRGVRVKQNAEFKVHTKDAGKAEVKIQIIGPGGVNVNCTVKPSKTEEGVYECLYIPPKVGQYVINVTYGGQHITKSPFRVDVGPEKFSKVVAFGPGLEGGVVNQPACFTVETNGEVGALGFSIEGPSQAKIDCKDNGDGSADVTYWPTVPGEYAVHILCNDEDIPQAPYMAQIQPATNAFDASKVIAKGPGLEKDGVVVGKVTEFTVDAKKAGKAPLHITCIDENYKPVEVVVKDNKDSTYSCKYHPKTASRHTIIITWGTVGIPKSPFRVNVGQALNPGNVKVYGPGVEKGVKTWVKTHFIVDCKTAGPGDVAIALTDDKGKDVPCQTTDNHDGTFTVEYEPRTPGTYTVAVFFATKEVPKSPIKVKVESSIDLSKVTVKGLETPIMVKEARTITVVTTLAKKKDAPCTITISMPSGKTIEMTLTVVQDGYSAVFTPTEVGKHTVTITYGEMTVPKSPYTIMVEIAVDVSMVQVKGLEKPIPMLEVREIFIITHGLAKKDAPCKVTITTPKNKTVELPVKRVPDLGYQCDFKPTEQGPHKVTVEYDKKPAPGSPFTVEVIAPLKKVAQVEVKGLETPIEIGETRPITIVTTSMPKKDAPCKATCTNPKGKTVELPLKKSPEGYTTSLKPTEAGPHKVAVEYANKPVPKSPFSVDVVPKGFKPAAKTEIEVKGLDTPIQTGEKRVVIIIIKNPKKGAPFKMTATNPKGRTTELKPKATTDGFEVIFTPWDSGVHKVTVEYDSKDAPGSPFNVDVYKTNLSAVLVKGLEKPIPLGQTRKISIITKDTGKPDLPCKVTVTSPTGSTTELPTHQTPDGYDCDFTPKEPGEFKVKVEYAAKEVPKSPFTVQVEVSDIQPKKVGKPLEETPLTAQKAPTNKAAPGQKPKEPGEGGVRVVGLDTPVAPGEKRPVVIDTTNAPKKDAPCKLSMTNPKGRTVELKTKPGAVGYVTTFSSWDKGPHTVKVEYDGSEIPDSPYEVMVEKIDVSQVKVTGLEKPIDLGETRKVTINTAATGRPDAPCNFTATGPSGKPSEVPTERNPDGYDCYFTPTEKGDHTVKITYAGKEVPNSPFTVGVTALDVSSVKVKGLEKAIMVGEKRKISIITTPTGRSDLPCKVHVTNPRGVTTELFTSKTPEGHETIFTPTDLGNHKVKIEVAGQEVPGSEFPVTVTKFELRVEVEGLDTPILAGEKRVIKVLAQAPAKPNRFAPEPTCKITVSNPKGRNFEPKMDKISTGFETFYSSTEPGPHVFKIEHNGKEIHDSPITCEVEKLEPRKVEVKGLETPIEVGETRPITIDATAAGKVDAPCKVQAVGPKGDTKDLPTKPTPQGYETSYSPMEVGPHKIKVEYGGKEVPKSPYPVEVQPRGKDKPKLSKVEVKGLETPVTVGEKRPITVKSDKPDAPVKITSTTPKGKATDVPTKKIKEGFEGLFAPVEEGPYKVKVEHAGKEIPESPFSVQVNPKAEVGKIQVKGLETPVKIGEKRPVTVVTKSTGKPNAPCKMTATNPKGTPTDLPLKKTPEGYETLFAPVEDGPHLVRVQFDNKELPNSPFAVSVERPVNLDKVKVTGLETPVEVGETRAINVITKDTGNEDAPCKVTATTPQGRTIFVPTKKVPHGYESSFTPKETGPHKLKVEFNDKEIPKSPFNVDVEGKLDITKVQVKGLEKPIQLGETRPISIVTATTGKPDAPCRVFAKGPNSPYIELPTKKSKDGYQCAYKPEKRGPNDVKVEFAGKEVPNSPFFVGVESPVDVSKVQIKGLERPIEVGEPRPVLIDTSSTGKPDAPCKVTVTNPKGQTAQLPTKKVPEGYATTFAPKEPGPHKVNVNFAGQEVPKSPFSVNAVPKANVGAVSVRGLEKPIEVGEDRPITVDTTATGRPDAPCTVSATNPKGQTVELPTKPTTDGYETTFAPVEPGPHKVNVDFAEQPVPNSPFSVDVQPKTEINNVTVSGLETPVEVGEIRPVQINTVATGKPDAPCHVSVTNPQGQVSEIPSQITPEGYQTTFAPVEPGPHKVNVNFAGKEVPKSPFTVNVEPQVDVGSVEVMGLDTPIKVGEPRPITVMTSTTGRPDAPCKVAVTNPHGKTVELPTRKIPEGYTATLAPQEVGPHKVNVNFNGKEVPKSPFNVMAEPAIDFNKVKVQGLEKPVEVGEIRPVQVDTAETGVVDAPCQVTSTNPVGQVRELPLQKTPRGYQAQFAPVEEGPHKVAVKYAGKEVPKSPFPVNATPAGPPASKVKAYGPGLESGTATTPCQFTIDTRDVTQPGGLGVTVEGPAESKIECRDNQDGTCDVTYFPTVPGEYSVNVTYADEHIPKSPFKPKIKPSGDFDLSRVKVYGPGVEPGVFLDSPTGFTVDAKSVTPTGEGKVRAIVTSPSGQRTESLVNNKKDGTYDVLYTPYEQGPNTVDVTYEDCPIPQSPIKVDAAPGCDASRVKAYGPGLERGTTDVQQVFTVDVKGAGQGGLALAIDGPAETQINCKDNRDGTCEVEYVPVKKGEYDITVKFADQHVPGSPFHVGVQNPVNPAKVQCYGPGIDSKEVKAGVPATFTVDTSEAGEAPLDVTYTDNTGKVKPAEIVPVAAGKYEAKYFPDDEGKCKVDVKYANQHVPNSPFSMRVQPQSKASKVRLSGDGIQPTVLASMPVQFTIDTREAGTAELDVVIQRPDGSFIRPMIQDNMDGTFTCQYTPEDCGPYNISATFDGQPVTEQPIRTTAVPTGDASKCKITDGLQHTIPVEKETVICVDASQAGTGKVTCRIRSPQGAEIDIDIVENVDGTFSIQFTPAFPGDYSISIKFGGQSVPNGDYVIQAVTDDVYQDYLRDQVGDVGEDFISPDTVDSVHSAAPGSGLYAPQEFCIPVGPIFNFVTAYVTMPSGKKAYPKIDDNKDGTVTVRYQPQETGLHELHVCYNQQEIDGSPFQFHVDAVNAGFVTAYGPGLSHGVVNVPAEFTIVTKDAGAGGLSLAIEGPSKTEIKCKDNEDGTCTVTYVPTAPGEYNITVKFADKNISGSPFTAKITAGEPKQRAQIGRSSEVSLKVTETDITQLTASILTPSGVEEPCMLKRLPNGHLGISFTPRQTGEHLVNVYRDGQHIDGSPFKIMVEESELGNAGKVKVHGKGLTEGMANEVNEFIVDTREAGYGGLSLSIEGPSKADIECHDNEDGTCRVTYRPTEPGTYIINIKFADEHVTGSPFKVKIGGEPSERITERIMRHREAADVTHVGSECELSLKIPVSFLRMTGFTVTEIRPGTSPFDMTASVTSPSGVTELCDVVSLDDCHYSIKFVPREMGIHTVSVKHKDMHIPGSPFQFTVGPIAGGGAHKVHAAGLGLVRGEVDQPNEFNVYTREAGAGGLSIAVEGPSKADVDFEDRKDGSCGVTYRVNEPGEYLISIKFNDDHIPDSPFRVPITPSVGDARKISVSALQNKGLTIGKPCSFVVNFNGAPKGKLQARVVSPSGAEDNALVQEIDDGEYAVRFIPRENGPHLVYVSFDKCQIPDSPFRIQVGTVHADPGMVQAYGDGLKTGKTDQTAKFTVNTVNAGSGALAVTVEGPSKVKLECKEVEDGYEFNYTPTAPGDYLITIKYAGTNIAGSPYKARIEGAGKPSGFQEQSSVVVETVTKTSVMSKFASLAPFVSDASKVTCDGNGLKKGYRNKQCTFNVDTQYAGNNMLFLGMIGPKGPCEELCVKHYPGMPYKITYLVKERGDYMLAVKWGEEHIPGSPFYVKVE